MMLDISRDTQGFLRGLQQPKQYKQIASKIFSLPADPKPPDSKHLSGFPGFLRVDCGEYRIVYKIEGAIIRIVQVGKRNDDEVYKKMSRKVG